MQFNCNGLRNKVIGITNFMHDNNILIAALQETKLTMEKPSDFVEPDKRTFVNYNKANWHGFMNFIDDSLRHLPSPSCARKGERILREVILKAAKRFIPAGRIPLMRPNYPSRASRLAQQRDQKRVDDPADERIVQLNAEIENLVLEHRRSKWIQHLDHCTINSKQLWSTIKNLSGSNKNRNLPAIAFNNITYSDAKKCATQFCRQFIEHPSSQNRSRRAVFRRCKSLKRDLQPISFTSSEVERIISKSKPSKALGPDGISMVMLKKLGAVGLSYLTKVLELSISQLVIPDVWKVARIIPILKPDKSATNGESYRPISMLSPVAKVLESLLLPSLKQHFHLASHQHGFREAHSATTALQEITTKIANGLNQRRPPKRTIVAALDLSKAFDTVDHSMLISDVMNPPFPMTPSVGLPICGHIQLK
ncbi:uncharacterized protein [Musca autumnalis]|uniref:uncharacterized protein n=1 Tax=Musca autumnalis TaxID=221902 RepID=UPI003CEE8175